MMRPPALRHASVIFGAALAASALASGAGCGFDGEAAGAATGDVGDATSTADGPPSAEGGSDGAPSGHGDGGGGNGDGATADDGGVYRQPTLLLWLDGSDPAGDGTQPAEGTPVAAWVDKARAHTVTQSMSSRRALFRKSGIAGKPSLQFDGKDDFFDVDLDINGAVLPDATIIAVFQNAPGDTSSYAGVWGHDNGGWDRFIASGGSANLNGVSNGTGFTTIAGLTANSVPLVATVVMHGNVANQSHAYVNGVLAATFNGSINPGTTHLSVGNLNGPSSFGAAWSFDGYIAEVLVYGSALADPARQAIEAGLKTKYTP